MDDLLMAVSENSVLVYADDTAVIASGKTWPEAERKWTNTWMMSLCGLRLIN